MDIPQVLAVLRPNDDWGPCANSDNTYAELAAAWRSKLSACPTESEMLAQWDTIVANAPQVALNALRAGAQDRLNNNALSSATLIRAFVLVLVDELNILRERLAAQDAAVAAATSLADLKNRWSTLAANSPVPDRTGVQARQAIIGKITSGNADS